MNSVKKTSCGNKLEPSISVFFVCYVAYNITTLKRKMRKTHIGSNVEWYSKLRIERLRSANSRALVVPRSMTTIGRRDFAVVGPSTCGLHHRPEIHLRKNSKLIYLAASTFEVFSNWALYKLTYSFIHSFIYKSTVFRPFFSICSSVGQI